MNKVVNSSETQKMWTCCNRKAQKPAKPAAKTYSLSTNYLILLIMKMFELIRTQ